MRCAGELLCIAAHETQRAVVREVLQCLALQNSILVSLPQPRVEEVRMMPHEVAAHALIAEQVLSVVISQEETMAIRSNDVHELFLEALRGARLE